MTALEKIRQQIQVHEEALKLLRLQEKNLINDEKPPVHMVGKYVMWEKGTLTTYMHITKVERSVIGYGYVGMGPSAIIDRRLITTTYIARSMDCIPLEDTSNELTEISEDAYFKQVKRVFDQIK